MADEEIVKTAYFEDDGEYGVGISLVTEGFNTFMPVSDLLPEEVIGRLLGYAQQGHLLLSQPGLNSAVVEAIAWCTNKAHKKDTVYELAQCASTDVETVNPTS